MRSEPILKFGIFLCNLVIFAGCINEDQTKTRLTSNKTNHINKIAIKELGTVYFRRSYAGPAEMTDEQLEKLQQSNPTIDSFRSDKNLIECFRVLGLTKQNELLLKNINFTKLESFELSCLNKDTIQVRMSLFAGEDGFLEIKVSKNGHTALAKLEDHFLPPLEYALLDIIKGGYPEILVLDQYYIMNGDNYDFHVYEIK